MLHVTEFNASGLMAAYTDTTRPEGRVIGKDGGNAVLLATDNGITVVSIPHIDGSIMEWFPEALDAPKISLQWAFYGPTYHCGQRQSY